MQTTDKMPDQLIKFQKAGDMARVFSEQCKRVMSEPGLIEKLKAENYDLAITEPFDTCAYGMLLVLENLKFDCLFHFDTIVSLTVKDIICNFFSNFSIVRSHQHPCPCGNPLCQSFRSCDRGNWTTNCCQLRTRNTINYGRSNVNGRETWKLYSVFLRKLFLHESWGCWLWRSEENCSNSEIVEG